MMMSSMITFVSELSFVQLDTHGLFCDSSFKTALVEELISAHIFPFNSQNYKMYL